MPHAGAIGPVNSGDKPHAVVIGAGFGGLAAAVRLGARGFRVTVLDRLDKPGGRAYVFDKDGFRFDSGPTIVTAPFLFDELWALCGRKLADDVDLRSLEPFYTIRFDDGSALRYGGNETEMAAQIARLEPADVDGYRRFMAFSERLYKVGYEDCGAQHFRSFIDMLKLAPALIASGAHRSVYSTVSRFFRHPKHRQAFSLHPLLIGANPLMASSIYILINHLERAHGVHFAMGGTGSLINGLVGLIEGQGGRVRCNADVAEIRLRDGRANGVRLNSGETIDAAIVVSNADAAWTYLNLLPQSAKRRWTDRKLKRARYSNGLFVWYFGTDRRYEAVDHHTIMLGPRYRALLKDIFSRKVLADDFSLYLHRPTATDASLAPDGCDTFYVLAPVPNLESETDWSVAAEPFRQRIEDYLENTILPDLGDHVVTSRCMTPVDFQDRLLSYRGAGFGLEPVLWQSAWFRPNNVSEGVENLFLVGANTHPGAGIPGVVTSAKILDEVVPDAAAFAN